ncbi:MAG: L-2-amino-thiazoline-4-carboxylic acid hydrolase [Candidatus Thorarchaeota archaeon]
MKSILVFIDGTICDTRHRHHYGIKTLEFNKREEILKDKAVPDSVGCLNKISNNYEIVYIGARPKFTIDATKEWLEKEGFPKGDVYLGETQKERLEIIEEIKNRYNFLLGVGDRWDDNELHLKLGCLSIILEEFNGKWDFVCNYIMNYDRKIKITQNETHLKGKIEGLARVLPKLFNKYGEEMWEVYFNEVLKMAEKTRQERRKEELELFEKFSLSPQDLRDVAKWEELVNEQNWKINEAFGLQDKEIINATKNRLEMKVTRCRYAEIWKEFGFPEIGYQIHCRTDFAWWNRPAWNPNVRFEQPKTLMNGDKYCLFIQYLHKE